MSLFSSYFLPVLSPGDMQYVRETKVAEFNVATGENENASMFDVAMKNFVCAA